MSLKKSSFLFASGTVLSRLLGLARESTLAGVFGASSLLDSFLIANKIPNMLREIAAEGALGSSFTQVYTRLHTKDPYKARQLLISTLMFILIFLGGLTFVGIWGSPALVKILMLFESSDRGENFFDSTVGLTRLLFPFILLMSFASIFSGVLHQKGRFFISALSPVLLNLGYIFGALVLASLFKKEAPQWIEYYFADRAICGLAVGVLLGGLFQTLWLFWSIKSVFKSKEYELKTLHNTKTSFFNTLWSQDLKKVLSLMGPMVIAASSGQINVLVNTNFATSLALGSVSYLNFAFRLLQLPIGVFAVAISTVSLASLTKKLSLKRQSNTFVSQEIEKSLELTLWLLCPCFIFLLVYRLEIIKLLFFHGNFDLNDTNATASCLFYYSFGVIGYGFIKVLSSIYYAIEKTNFAMKVSLIGIIANFILNYIFVKPYSYNGLALASSFTLSVNAALLFWGLKKFNVYTFSKSILKSLSLIFITTFVFFVLSRYTLGFMQELTASFSNSIKIQSLLTLLYGALSLLLLFLFSYWLSLKIKAQHTS